LQRQQLQLCDNFYSLQLQPQLSLQLQHEFSLFSSGFGFVSFADEDCSQRALEAMSGFAMEGRHIRVERARRAQAHNKTPGKCKQHKAVVVNIQFAFW
jgi:RNA recognition motif-containing protein